MAIKVVRRDQIVQSDENRFIQLAWHLRSKHDGLRIGNGQQPTHSLLVDLPARPIFPAGWTTERQLAIQSSAEAWPS